MGPPPFGDGNKNNAVGEGPFWVFLQWGHRLSAMETPSAKNASRTIPDLQWGHRLSAMETLLPSASDTECNVPSMGPPPFGDGNQPVKILPDVDLTPPSMGPPPFGDGNLMGCSSVSR